MPDDELTRLRALADAVRARRDRALPLDDDTKAALEAVDRHQARQDASGRIDVVVHPPVVGVDDARAEGYAAGVADALRRARPGGP